MPANGRWDLIQRLKGYNCGIITSNPPSSFLPKTNRSWGVCGWQKNWIGKSK